MTLLSRSAKVVLLNVESTNDETRKTRACPGGRAQITACGRLLAGSIRFGLLVALGPELDGDAGRLQTMLLQIGRLFVNHALNFESRQTAGNRRQLSWSAAASGSTIVQAPSAFCTCVVSPSKI